MAQELVVKHPLQKFDVAVEEAVKAEEEAPRLTADAEAQLDTVGSVSIAGFEMYDRDAVEEARERAVAERREQAQRYKDDRTALQGALESCGVTALGYAPANAWDFICLASGLYRLRFGKSGKVGVDRVTSEATRFFAAFGFYLVHLALIAYATMMLYEYQALWVTTPTIGYGVGAMAMFLFTLVAVLAEGLWIPMMIDPIERIYVRYRLHRMSHEDVLKAMMPNGHSKSGPMELFITLPEPPAEVQTKLLKLQKLPDVELNHRGDMVIETVVDAGAMSFNPPLEDQIMGDLKAKQESTAEVRRINRQMNLESLLNPDPIVAVRYRSAVALVDQFGDFPIEEAVMERALTTEHIF